MLSHTKILKLPLTLTDIHTCMLTHMVLYSTFLSPTQSLKYSHVLKLCLLWAEGEQKKMKNEPNNVRLKAAPIKRITGSKVCKDGVEVLWLLPEHKYKLEVCSGKDVCGQKKRVGNCTFCRNWMLMLWRKFRLGSIRFSSKVQNYQWIAFFKGSIHFAIYKTNCHTHKQLNYLFLVSTSSTSQSLCATFQKLKKMKKKTVVKTTETIKTMNLPFPPIVNQKRINI